MIKKQNKKKAFTLSEVLIALMAMGVLVSLSISTIRKNDTMATDKVAIVKADATISMVVDRLVNESAFYSTSKDLSVKNEAEWRRFRNEFFKYMMLSNARKSGEDGQDRRGPVWLSGSYGLIDCQQSMDGIIWCIPETDFNYKNTVTHGDAPYATVIVYLKGKVGKNTAEAEAEMSKNAEAYFKRFAIAYGVRRDGQIVFLNELIDRKSNPNSLHYRAQDLLRNTRR